MEKVQWKVEGMDCTTCALNIQKYLDKKGATEIRVNFATGDVSFAKNEDLGIDLLAAGVTELGYKVIRDPGNNHTHAHDHDHDDVETPFFTTHLQRFWFCLPFTAILMLHMIPGLHIHWLMNHWVQLGLTIPVYLVGMSFFGKSAWKIPV